MFINHLHGVGVSNSWHLAKIKSLRKILYKYQNVSDCVHYIYKVKLKKNISLNKSEQTYVWLKYTYTTATESLFLVSPSTYVYTEVVDLNISVHNLF